MRSVHKKNYVSFSDPNQGWEVEAKREYLRKGSWAIILNGKFISRVEANSGVGAILKSEEVPTYIREKIRQKMLKRGR